MKTVMTVPHQDDGYVRIPAHTDLRQGIVLPLGLLGQASRDFYSRQAESMPLLSLEAVTEDRHRAASHKNMGVKSLREE